MGTPDFAVPTLEAFIESRHEIVAVYTRAPQPGGRRGLEITKSPVHRVAELHNIRVETPRTLRDSSVLATLKDFNADKDYMKFFDGGKTNMPRTSHGMWFLTQYVRFGKLPQVEGLLYGVKPVIIAVVVQALWGLGQAAAFCSVTVCPRRSSWATRRRVCFSGSRRVK